MWGTISVVNIMKNPHAVALGRKGGKARKAALTPERRSEIARLAINTRWKRVRDKAKRPRRKAVA